MWKPLFRNLSQMTNLPITIIIPMRNAADTIVTAVESLLPQLETRNPNELLHLQSPPDDVVIVDDCSEDNSVEIVRDFCKCNDAAGNIVSVIQLKEHHHQYHAKNVALHALHALQQHFNEELSGYIGFMDADDIAYPDRVARQVKVLDNNPEVWAVGGACHNFEDGVVPSDKDTEIAWPMDSDPLLKGIRQFGIGLWNATALYRAETIQALGSFDYTPSMGDTEWFVRLVWGTVMHGKKLRNLQSPVIHRRLRKNQVSATVSGPRSPFRTAYETFVKHKFVFYRTLYNLGMLRKEHIYRTNDVRENQYLWT